VSLDLNELRELLAAIDQTDIAELTLKSADFELTVRRGFRVDERLYSIDALPSQTTAGISAAAMSLVEPPEAPPTSGAAAAIALAATAAPAPSDTLRESRADRRLVDITSPMVGTFYRAPGPDDPAFVDVGDRIKRGQAVCIIEAMKLMNELEAEISGEVVEILAVNGEPVEYGQLLMRVNPD